jgi:hypothetical protein
MCLPKRLTFTGEPFPFATIHGTHGTQRPDDMPTHDNRDRYRPEAPNGEWIAFADVAAGEEHASIYLLSTETLETRQTSISPCVGEGLPAFSHNGEYLAYWCFLRGCLKSVMSVHDDSA